MISKKILHRLQWHKEENAHLRSWKVGCAFHYLRRLCPWQSCLIFGHHYLSHNNQHHNVKQYLASHMAINTMLKKATITRTFYGNTFTIKGRRAIGKIPFFKKVLTNFLPVLLVWGALRYVSLQAHQIAWQVSLMILQTVVLPTQKLNARDWWYSLLAS